MIRPIRVWHWRWELSGLACLGLVETALVRWSWPPAPLLPVAVAVVLVADRSSRRGIGRRLSAVLVQHRVRAAMRASGLRSMSGRRPALLWTSPTGTGQRLWLWCPMGLAAGDVRVRAGALAAACRADAVLVATTRWHPRLLALEVVRAAHVASPIETGLRPGSGRPGGHPE